MPFLRPHEAAVTAPKRERVAEGPGAGRKTFIVAEGELPARRCSVDGLSLAEVLERCQFLKENVIMGRLVPAGAGLAAHHAAVAREE